MSLVTAVTIRPAPAPDHVFPRLVRGGRECYPGADTCVILQTSPTEGVCLHADAKDTMWAVGEYSGYLDPNFWVPLPAGSSITITVV